jgi:hypothetical protein
MPGERAREGLLGDAPLGAMRAAVARSGVYHWRLVRRGLVVRTVTVLGAGLDPLD